MRGTILESARKQQAAELRQSYMLMFVSAICPDMHIRESAGEGKKSANERDRETEREREH